MSPGVLLVHGAWHGPWCWHEFAQRLAEHGNDTRVVQLRGHDRRSGRIWYRLQEYVEDVERAAAAFPFPPVLVGHSMGGILVQRYLERNPASGAVLMASLGPGDRRSATVRLAARHPLPMLKASILWSLRPIIATDALVRDLFFTPETSPEIVEHCRAHLQDESYRAFLELVFGSVNVARTDAPVLVLGAERDGILEPAEIRKLAAAYRTEAEIFPEMGHDMMLDHGWRDVADRVGHWIRDSINARRNR
jgi:pimeloyl-ACP methyl ester carboxylesterase